MDKNAVIEYLEDNELSEVEELPYDDKDAVVLRFYYDFDEEEVSAAEAYADDESGEKNGSKKWKGEFFIPYLSELAVDTVGQIIEDLMEDLEVEAQFTSYEVDEEEPDYTEFIAIFYPKDKKVEIDEVLEKLDL
ncbi:hypothetical protein CLLI_19140 [Clostridium liquoris]|uniref:Uncharacterized protein n=1 Tax=Clostridium liquoris TaxID=1289519 RepID=A0A2T0B2M6_9CLOT|nr:hypothetical protein [Clostridium liquoris]PRR78150.1 hypothetical protein CLLI_19140 [Clostridium liquoris]